MREKREGFTFTHDEMDWLLEAIAKYRARTYGAESQEIGAKLSRQFERRLGRVRSVVPA